MSARSRLRSAIAGLGVVALMGALAACGDDEEPTGERGSAISAERCKANEEAGTVTYMSGYYWQSSASILEVIAADELGYFDDLCLDVELQAGPGDTTQNAKLLASGKVQVTALSQQDVITNNLNGVNVQGVSSYSDAGLEVLLTNDDVTDLAQLKGKKVGHKGWIPLSITAMLAENGVPLDDVEQVKVGYDPTVLTRGQVDALTGFISNDAKQLQDAGEKVTVWQPTKFGVPDSLGALAINPAFGKEHPTAVEDFLRAAFKAYRYCADEANVDECIGFQGEKAGADADPAHEKDVWTTEVQVVADNPLPGKFGSVDLDNVGKLAGLVNDFWGQKVTAEQAQGWFTNEFSNAVVDDKNEVVWPAP